MPKVIARSTVSTSDSVPGYNDELLSVLYCLCGEYTLILDQPLAKLPRRRTDGAHIIVKAQHTWKLNAVNDARPIYVRRKNGVELQYRRHCRRCGLLVAYEPTEHSPHVYIVDGAVVGTQEDVAGTTIDIDGPEPTEASSSSAAGAGAGAK